jgi:hypothetical protein
MGKVCRETCKIMKLNTLNPMLFPQRCGGKYSWRIPASLLFFGLCFTSACNSNKMKLPTTYPVRGKVVFRQGGAFPGGTISFQSKVNSTVTASSLIKADGTFELKSFISGDEAPGAIAGLHRVIVVPPLDDKKALASLPPTIPPQTVKVSEGENNLTITIDK